MRINCSLLLNLPHALDIADAAGVLSNEKARMRTLHLSIGFPLFFGILQGLQL